MLCYCDKCGNICEAFTDELEDGCFCCGNSPLIIFVGVTVMANKPSLKK